jgi:hypothetical protein
MRNLELKERSEILLREEREVKSKTQCVRLASAYSMIT